VRRGTCKTSSPRSPAAATQNVLVTERGASFGYKYAGVGHARAADPPRATTGAPVIFDATHSVQQPGGKGASSGGEREFVPSAGRAPRSRSAWPGVFIETHPDPDHAPSDGHNMVPLREFEGLVRTLMAFDALAKNLDKNSRKECNALMRNRDDGISPARGTGPRP